MAKKKKQSTTTQSVPTPVWKMDESTLRKHRVKNAVFSKDKSFTAKRLKEERLEKKEAKRRSRGERSMHLSLKAKIAIGLIAFFLIAGGAVFSYLSSHYAITSITISGNSHYTDEEIINLIMTDQWDYNSLILNWRYHHKEVDSIPFVSAVEVNVVSANAVNITIYEKSIAGYVSFMGRYMYFDKDGTVVESSQRLIGDVPEVTGLSFHAVVVGEPLEVEDEAVFTKIINITQALEKYQLDSDQIYFDSDLNATLYFDQVRVKIGSGDAIDEKLSELYSILPKLEGKVGVLNMQNYTSNSTVVVFQSDIPLSDDGKITEEEIDVTLE
ncbi:MAG: FtsQ-type POTRA domain-containing protein [Lachnospiraceae bacterium]|nr:FtsQ-type POTRA domain-containing protein [Lachnospiraceae bacterium]